mmetsp:Transcript_36663/g.59257  ORF Transcript_36663/g.59257 Transcript_36663/m.59257 type:complete len:398 (-) Transcript_36663:315-1508(-)|eukprot:CAMPEP_0184664464 /NCGR_PEP_ID=MMETSP0308-20130426/52903_1 /TAXON_ID=38269 /ORGANISM="Gloeochaete witrockiana, Strain SAG 46.84" /LENGTH=397 /DNA_ID=CAMNT_0027107873 /DNA_START=82 /DNA_END=1275 /DNA_ORIENTATION=+
MTYDVRTRHFRFAIAVLILVGIAVSADAAAKPNPTPTKKAIRIPSKKVIIATQLSKRTPSPVRKVGTSTKKPARTYTIGKKAPTPSKKTVLVKPTPSKKAQVPGVKAATPLKKAITPGKKTTVTTPLRKTVTKRYALPTPKKVVRTVTKKSAPSPKRYPTITPLKKTVTTPLKKTVTKRYALPTPKKGVRTVTNKSAPSPKRATSRLVASVRRTYSRTKVLRTPSKRRTPSKIWRAPSRRVTPSRRRPTPTRRLPVVIREIISRFDYYGQTIYRVKLFAPNNITVPVGTTVIFRMLSPNAHQVSQLKRIGDGLSNTSFMGGHNPDVYNSCYPSDTGSSVPFPDGPGFCFPLDVDTPDKIVRFTTPGVYYFGCEPHLVYPLGGNARKKALMQGAIYVK